jgi:hypothetical protein
MFVIDNIACAVWAAFFKTWVLTGYLRNGVRLNL